MWNIDVYVHLRRGAMKVFEKWSPCQSIHSHIHHQRNLKARSYRELSPHQLKVDQQKNYIQNCNTKLISRKRSQRDYYPGMYPRSLYNFSEMTRSSSSISTTIGSLCTFVIDAICIANHTVNHQQQLRDKYQTNYSTCETVLNHSSILCPLMWPLLSAQMSRAKRSTHAMKLTLNRCCFSLLIDVMC